MAEAYYSTVFEHSAEGVWRVIRDFNNYPVWVDRAGESEIEEGKTGEAVGAVRNVLYDGRSIRQRLLALSDVERAQVFAFAEWWATFDGEPSSVPERSDFFRNAFARWLGSLRRNLERQARAA